MRSLIRLSLFAVVVFVLAVGARRRSVAPPTDAPLSLERSFAITDKAILDGFRFERVLRTLIDRSGDRKSTPESLFRQWLDTQNPAPGLDATAPHCNDFLVDGQPAHNGFRRHCPTPEGELAHRPFNPDDYVPIAIINRFDMADPAGTQCGQYRLIYVRRTPNPAHEAFRIIFEGALRNPRPEAGVAACRPVAQFWAELSGVASLSERRARLERFFFEGIGGFAPVVDPDHYFRAPAGIRTLQQSNGQEPRFYQWRLREECNGACRLLMKPDVLENLPFGAFFNASVDTPLARRFRENFLTQVKTLAVKDVNLYFMNVPDEFLIAESDPPGDDFPFIFEGPYKEGKKTPEGQAFDAQIRAELQKIGSTLQPEDIVVRADTQNCVGCHLIFGDVGEGVTFPRAQTGFRHVSEIAFERGEGGDNTRFGISGAMRDVFIPSRMRILKDYLLTGKAPVHSN